MRAPRYVVSVTALWVVSAFPGDTVRAQALPQSRNIIAKPSYIALVRAMREDELLLMSVRRQIESGRHPYDAQCLANLRPGLVKATIAWAIEPAISEQEVAEATRFFEREVGRKLLMRWASTAGPLPQLTATEEFEADRFMHTVVGNKLLVKNITRQSRVLVSLKSEVLDLLNICTDTLEGTHQVTYCESEWVPSADKACSARYDVTGRAGDAVRVTRVSLYCDFAGSDLTTLLTELPGQNETVGLSWLDGRTLEMLMPASVTPAYKQTVDRARGLRFEYRSRKPGDPPALACVPSAPLDEFGWPVG